MDALILTCGTGGGHNAAAEAIQEELLARGHQARLLNPYTLKSSRLANEIDHSYISTAQKTPKLFGLIYRIGNLYRRFPFRSPVYFAQKNMASLLHSYLQEHPADVVVMSHLFPAEIFTMMKEQGLDTPPTLFIATDYTCIPFTEETACDAYVVPSEDLVPEFIERGIPAEKIHPLGIPVKHAFSHSPTKAEARRILKMDDDATYALVAGGSIGAGKMRKVIASLDRYCRAHPAVKAVVICGNNQRLYQKLRKKCGGSIRVIPKTQQMAEYMAACDVFLTKPGGLSSTEAAVIGVPIVHITPIPGCETHNLHYFAAHGMSMTFPDKRIPWDKLFQTPDAAERQRTMSAKQQTCIPANAASEICNLAEEMSRESNPEIPSATNGMR